MPSDISKLILAKRIDEMLTDRGAFGTAAGPASSPDWSPMTSSEVKSELALSQGVDAALKALHDQGRLHRRKRLTGQSGRQPMEYWLPKPDWTVDEQQAPGWLAQGAEVEVRMQMEGLLGSLYSGRVLQMRESAVLVQYSALHAEDEGDGEGPILETEWISTHLIRPPPPQTPPGFPSQLPLGKLLSLLHEDGWWEVRLLERRPATGEEEASFLVRSDLYNVEHWVGADKLRPRWVFQVNRWRAEVGAAVVDEEAPSTQPLAQPPPPAPQPLLPAPQSHTITGPLAPAGWHDDRDRGGGYGGGGGGSGHGGSDARCRDRGPKVPRPALRSE